MTELQTQRKSGSRVGVSQFQISDIQPFFIYPLHEAATKMNISPSFLKKLCRRFGVMRWPFRTLRKIQGNDNMISSHNKMSNMTGTFYVSNPKDQQNSTKESTKQKSKKRDFVWVPFKGDKKLRTLMSKPDNAHPPPLAPLAPLANIVSNNTVQLVKKEVTLTTMTAGAAVDSKCNTPDLRPAVSSPQTNSSPQNSNTFGSWTCTSVFEANSPDSSNYMHTHSNAMSLNESPDDRNNDNEDYNDNNNTTNTSMLVFSQEFRFNRNPAWDFVLNVEDLSKFHAQAAPPTEQQQDVFCLNLDLTPFYLL